MVYRRACEPAHISDLPELLPRDDGSIPIASPDAVRRAQEAVHYGNRIMIDLLRLVSDNDAGIKVDVSRFEKRYRAIVEGRRAR